MNAETHELTPERLVTEIDGLRRLARHLVGDGPTADDIVQDACVAALEKGTGVRSNPGAWLRAVTRNAASLQRRSAVRRRRREEERAQPEALPAAAESAERNDVRRSLIRAVRELPEPYATVIHLRYIDGVSAQEIAQRLAEPVETVRTRIKRGLARLRRALDQRHDRRSWTVVLTQLGRELPSTPMLLGGLVLNKAVVGVVLLLFVAIAFYALLATPFFARDPQLSDGQARSVARAPQFRDGQPAGGPALQGRALRRKAASEEAAIGPAADGRTGTDPAAPATSPGIQGTLTLRRRDGRVVADPSGRMKLRVWARRKSGDDVQVDVTAGRWSLPQDDVRRIEPALFETGGQTASIVDAHNVSISEDRRVVLEARILPVTVLHVLDARTSKPLSDVRVLHPQGWAEPKGGLPGSYRLEGDVLRATGPSPLTLEPGAGRFVGHGSAVYAISPGYAWGRILLDTIAGGTRTVRLHPSAGLRVGFTGPTPPVDFFVVGWRGGYDAHAEPHFWFERFERFDIKPWDVDRLASGRYELRALVGSWWQPEATLLAKAVVDLEPGRTTDVTLDLAPYVKQPRVPLSGVVNIPAVYGVKKPRVDLEYLDGHVDGERLHHALWIRARPHALTSIGGPLGPWRFDVGQTPPGRYHVRVSGARYHGELVVGPAGDTNARIDVPPPGRVSVRVVDTRTGADADIDNIHWSMQAPRGVQTIPGWFGELDRDTNRFVLRAPAGMVEIATNNDVFAVEPCVVEVFAGGWTEATLFVTPAGMVDVEFVDGDAHLPCDWRWTVRAEQVDGDGKDYMTHDRAGARRLWVKGPGRYRIHVEPIPGYEPIPEQEVDVAIQRVTKVLVRLVRER